MKNMKKLLALVIAVAMVLAMGVSVFAADETYSITIKKNSTDKAAHTYSAYQLFKGDLAEAEGKKVLSNIDWATGVNGASIITQLKTIADFASLADNASAATVAKAISDANYTNDSAKARALAEALFKGIQGVAPKGSVSVAADATSGKIEGLEAGYYLVMDSVKVTGEGADTRYILEVVSNVTVDEKADVPSVDKEIAETTPTKVSDYDIGDSIPYTITGTLPSTFADFATYKTFTFTDQMSDGLTPPAANDISVKIGNDDIKSLFDVVVDGKKITVSLKSGIDLKTATHGNPAVGFAANDKIVVSYSATLNESAVIGGAGNINTAMLEFSNNPNSDGDGDKGTTPEDKTVVFTYTIKALKVEPTSDAAIDQAAYDALTPEQKADYVKVGDKWQKTKALDGAGFTLYKDSKSEQNKVAEITSGSTFEFKGVDAGTYILSETTVPAGYNQVADITIVVTAEYDKTTTPPTLKSLTCTPSDFVATASTGTVEGKILNEKGSELPTTGGIGTTIFYIVGAILVVGGGILLISRRRTSSN